jgi:4-hydroxythreonine-4-phosphate dehydrogenase
MGDVNGVGPEILAKALAREDMQACADYLVFGERAVLAQAAAVLGVALPALDDFAFGSTLRAGVVGISNAGKAAAAVQAGVLSAEAGACAHHWIGAATAAVALGDADALVTCPVNKEAMLLAGHGDLGHTELLSRLLNAPDWRMCLYTEGRLVVHLSGHLSLMDALRGITTESVCASVRVAHEALLRMGIAAPRIAVAGINPHAGEHGVIGHEDEALLVPAVAACVGEGIACTGPHSPDAVFRQLWQGQHDAVIAMYHDQGHIAMKMVAMDETASLTLGLPIVRTSPDHGTAFDIAWTGQADERSLCAAIKLAARLARPRQKESA